MEDGLDAVEVLGVIFDGVEEFIGFDVVVEA